MKNNTKNLLVFLLAVFLIGCNNQNSSVPISTILEESIQTDVPTSTTVPTPTSTPTPLPVTRIKNGDYAFFIGEFSKAADEFKLVLGNATDKNILAQANVYLGQIEIKNNNCPGANMLLNSVANEPLIESTIRAKAYYLLAICELDANRFTQAAEAFSNYVEVNPGVLDLFMYEKAGDAYSSAADLDTALSYYTKAVESVLNENTDSVKIKIGQVYASQLDYTNAIRVYMEVYDQSANEYTRAQMNFLTGQAYLMLGLPEQAYARFQESVLNYPKAYDTYSGLVVLVEEGIEVDEFYRGLVDYYAGRYGLAIDAFNRYLSSNPDHNGSAHYFKAFAYRAIDQVENAIQEWKVLIQDHPDDRFYVDAWEDIAYTQWAFQNDYLGGAGTLLSFVKANPSNEGAPQAIFDAARIYERSGYLTEAAFTWARLIEEYPQAEIASQGLYLSGISSYRLNNYQPALEKFQKVLLFGGSPALTAATQLWIGKTEQKLGNMEEAKNAWKLGSTLDPTGYYSIRCQELLSDLNPYSTALNVNLQTNMEQERIIAEIWMQNTFNLPAGTNFTSTIELMNNQNFSQATALWDLGLFEAARDKFEIVREENSQDALSLFRLTNYFHEIGLYRSALLGSRQILQLANMDDLDTLNAPLWFNHIRFGNYYPELVFENSKKYNFDPILILSLIRQESFYEGFISSSAGARGVMQIMPETGNEIHTNINWPENYSEDDLYNPSINIRFGVSYLARMRDYFNGNLFAALAAYNAGPGNVLNWENQAENDPDLFLEIVPFEETRRYITNIYEFYHLYKQIYPNNP